MSKARKNHICTLCHETIEAGTTYIYRTITPWCHPDNESFGSYKAHHDCHVIWGKVGDEFDWIFPIDKYEWAELIAELRKVDES